METVYNSPVSFIKTDIKKLHSVVLGNDLLNNIYGPEYIEIGKWNRCDNDNTRNITIQVQNDHLDVKLQKGDKFLVKQIMQFIHDKQIIIQHKVIPLENPIFDLILKIKIFYILNKVPNGCTCTSKLIIKSCLPTGIPKKIISLIKSLWDNDVDDVYTNLHNLTSS